MNRKGESVIIDKEKLLQVCIDKREGKLNKSWDELAKEYDYINGENLRCWAKKQLKKKGQLPSKEQEISKDVQNKLDEIDFKILKLQEERKKVQTVKVEYNKILRENARKELINEEIIKAIKDESLIPPKFNIIHKQDNEKGYILGFGDIHAGKTFKSINNEYSIGILNKRLELLMSDTIKFVDRENVKKLNVLNLSDCIDGLLRIAQLQALEMGVIDSVIYVARLLSQWLNDLSKYVLIDYKHSKSANHSQLRFFNTPAGQFPNEDLERVIITYIHDVLANNERIHIDVPEDKHIRFDLCGYKFIALHGNGVKNIRSSVKDLSMLYREFFDYCISAHLHHGEEIDVGEGEDNNLKVILLPSIMGSDDYSDSLMTGSKAGAKILTFEKGYGHVQTNNIILN